MVTDSVSLKFGTLWIRIWSGPQFQLETSGSGINHSVRYPNQCILFGTSVTKILQNITGTYKG
jgi:hypothetical protein